MRCIAGIPIAAAVLLASCTETRVIEERGFITLRELQPGGLRPVQAERESAAVGFESVLMKDSMQGTPDEHDPLRRTLPGGQVRLYSFSPRHLIHHMLVTLAHSETALINEWILSASLKELYKADGRDPDEIAAYMVEHAPEIIQLLKLVPLGESTPGAVFEDIGRNRYRLAPLGSDMLELRFHAIQLAIENGEFRLLMIE